MHSFTIPIYLLVVISKNIRGSSEGIRNLSSNYVMLLIYQKKRHFDRASKTSVHYIFIYDNAYNMNIYKYLLYSLINSQSNFQFQLSQLAEYYMFKY